MARLRCCGVQRGQGCSERASFSGGALLCRTTFVLFVPLLILFVPLIFISFPTVMGSDGCGALVTAERCHVPSTWEPSHQTCNNNIHNIRVRHPPTSRHAPSWWPLTTTTSSEPVNLLPASTSLRLSVTRYASSQPSTSISLHTSSPNTLPRRRSRCRLGPLYLSSVTSCARRRAADIASLKCHAPKWSDVAGGVSGHTYRVWSSNLAPFAREAEGKGSVSGELGGGGGRRAS